MQLLHSEQLFRSREMGRPRSTYRRDEEVGTVRTLSLRPRAVDVRGTVANEDVEATVAVPIVLDDRLLGVLYGADRRDGAAGDRATRTLVDTAAGMTAAELVAERARSMVDAAVRAERRKVGRELQDAVGARLLALRYGVRRLATLPGLDHDIRSRLVAIEAQAVEAAAALRRSLHLSSATPARVPLHVAIRTHCEAFQRRTAIATRMTTLTDLPPMTASRVAALADAARESLLNVEKHARARSVVATVLAVADRVAVTISDDGVGLPDCTTLEHGLGIAAVGEGLARVGGAMTIAPNEDGGVTVHAWVPN
jgi:signal transduction histidine kinase